MATLLLVIIYIAFISLGLPDAVLGAGWPVIQPDLDVPYSYAGIIQMIIAGGTILSSMFSGWLIKKMGTDKLTVASVSLTAIALLGYSIAPNYLWLILLALPLGIGAGAVDAALNSFVAEHYESRHMSWLHSFWGVGALSGPFILSYLLSHGHSWRLGYRFVGIFQIGLVVLLIVSLPVWKKVHNVPQKQEGEEDHKKNQSFNIMDVFKIKGVSFALIVYLLYCGIEASMSLWGGSYLYKVKHLNPADGATFVSLFFAFITIGRFLTGALTYRLTNNQMIRIGASIILLGVVLMILPLPLPITVAGFLLVGLGCAPIYPCMLHETPARFGRDKSQSIMGYQMAVAYIGTTILPPFFGFVASTHFMESFPIFILVYIGILYISFEALVRRTKA
ncbi:MFS transporter [Spirochaeta cellobiosiphila]|uniref:MFS transporter n=1 Tax=Spirochaeta cellobiosiphila TaxID=504483 RepID=UPI0004113DB9|nr:MFS transporter [Spirochaeta cellobiosiphila]